MKIYLGLVIVFCLLSPLCFSATNLDSLDKATTCTPDSAAVNKLIVLAEALSRKDEPAAAFLSKKAYRMAIVSGNKACRFNAAIGLASRLLSQGDYVQASSYLLEALKLAEELNSNEKIAKAYNNLGNLYGAENQPQSALPYYEKALTYYKSAKNKKGMGIVLSNMGNIYYAQSADKKNLVKAADYYLRVMEIARTLSDTNKMIDISNKMALVYSDMGKDKEALTLLKESKKYCEITRNDYDLIYNYSYTGRAYYDLKVDDSAIFYFSLSAKMAREMSDPVMVSDAEISLSEAYAQKKDFEKAFHYAEEYQSLHDSLLNSGNMKRIAEAQSLYDSEKRQRQIELLEISAQHERWINGALITGSVLLLILALLVLNRYKLKNRSHKLLEHQNQLIAQKNKDITDSINYARKIQDAMLPALSEINSAFPECFLIYYPKDIVSGDFYWFTEREGRKYIAVVDCTGHGVPGAFMSMIGNDMLSDAVAEKSLIDPGEILASLNQHVKKSLRQNETDSGSRDGMDAVICVFDRNGGKMRFSGANRPLYLIKGAELGVINSTKASIGGHTDLNQVFQSFEFELQKGDTVYLFSDGYCDQFGGQSGKKFTTKRFRDLLNEIKHEPMESQERVLREKFISWKQDNEQVDDVLIIGIRV
jgi:serine phosphatase RsbU (regulator of sigma subunit)